MADVTANEVLVYQCLEFFRRETGFWRRLGTQGTTLTDDQVNAKKTIVEAVFRVAAAALLVQKMSVTGDLEWDYRELQMEIEDHRRRVTIPK